MKKLLIFCITITNLINSTPYSIIRWYDKHVQYLRPDQQRLIEKYALAKSKNLNKSHLEKLLDPNDLRNFIYYNNNDMKFHKAIKGAFNADKEFWNKQVAKFKENFNSGFTNTAIKTRWLLRAGYINNKLTAKVSPKKLIKEEVKLQDLADQKSKFLGKYFLEEDQNEEN